MSDLPDKTKNIILGSSSPRRRDLLSLIVNPVEIMIPHADESIMPNEGAHEYCSRIARLKRDILIEQVRGFRSDILLITGDTTVSLDDHILGKPEDREDAVRMISILQGKRHQVLSSLALYARINNDEFFTDGIESTDVVFKSLSLDMINNYLSKIEYLDKAGSYAIQEEGRMIVDRIEGSLSNVVGFPLRLFFSLLDENHLLQFILY